MKTMVLFVITSLAACATTATTSAPRITGTTVSTAADEPQCKEIPRLDGQPSRCQAVPPAALRDLR